MKKVILRESQVKKLIDNLQEDLEYVHVTDASPKQNKYKIGLEEGNLLKHSWNKVENSRKLKHMKCKKCNCEKWWDQGFGQLMYQDRFGKVHYRAPKCVLPNAKL